ncbi:MAG: translocation/assembly module TamB, partial [Bacteroidales bacterium]|nr:translocation/assembly module TamB [Bacteroidales bacterium]
DSSCILKVEEVNISYKIRDLAQKKFRSNDIRILGMHVFLQEEKDSLWNIEKLIAQTEAPSKDSLSKTSKWSLNLEHLQFNNLEIHTSTLSTPALIPEAIFSEATMKISMFRDELKIAVDSFNLKAQNPSLEILNMQFAATIKNKVLNWEDFELTLPGSFLSSSGRFPLENPAYSDILLKANPFDFKDIENWLPNIYGKPIVNIQLDNEGDSSSIEISLLHENQSIIIIGSLASLNSVPQYHLNMDVHGLDGAYWTHLSEFTSNIQGQFKLKGSGLNFKDNTVEASASFSDLKYENYELKNIQLSVNKDKGTIDGTAKANTIFGDLDAHVSGTNLFDLPTYTSSIRLRNANLANITLNKSLASTINLDIEANGQGIKVDEADLNVKVKSINSVLFDQKINDFNATLALSKNSYLIEGLNLETPYMHVRLKGRGNFLDDNKLEYYVKATNVKKPLVALGLDSLDFKGELMGSMSGSVDQIDLNGSIKLEDFNLDSIYLSNSEADFHMLLPLKDLIADLRTTDTVSSIQPSTLAKSSFQTDISLGLLTIGKYSADKVSVELDKVDEKMDGSLTLNADWGFQETKFHLDSIFSNPNYELTSTIKNLNLSGLPGNQLFSSDLNLEIDIKGQGTNPKTLSANVGIQSYESSLLGFQLDNFDAKFSYHNGDYEIKDLRIVSPYLLFRASGTGNVYKDMQIDFNIQADDIKGVTSALGIENLDFAGEITGGISGMPDSIDFFSHVFIENLQYDTLHVKQVFADAKLLYNNSKFAGDLDLRLVDSKIQEFYLSQMHFTSTFNSQAALNSLTFFSSDSLNGRISNEIHFGKIPVFYFPELSLNLYNGTWEGGSPTNYIKFRKDSIEIYNMNISSDDGSFKADGIFSFKGNEDLHIAIQNMNLMTIPGIQILPFPVAGKINALLDIVGTAETPIIEGNVQINDFQIDTISLKELYADFSNKNKILKINSYLDDTYSRLISAEASLPLKLSFTEKIVFPPDGLPMDAKIIIDSFNVARLNQLISIDGTQTTGLLSSEIYISNTTSDPNINGSFNLVDASFSNKKLGMNYTDIGFSSHFLNNIMQIDGLHMAAGKGSMDLNGEIELESLNNSTLNYVKLNLKGQNFKAFDSEMLKAVINTDLNLTGTPAAPVMSGKVEILQSTLNTDIFLKEYNRVNDVANLPLLVQAQQANNQLRIKEQIVLDTAKKETPEIYKNLKGEFDIIIPRNTWVRGKNMTLEISGNLKDIKSGEQIDLFGTMNVKRGFYKIYGRRLEFEEGEVIFTGGKSLNPMVNFKIAYKFRDTENQLRTLYVKITGRYANPEVAFTLDDRPIEEKDAISYLLFNKNINELDTNENVSLINSNLDFAKDLAIGQFTNIVKDALQSTLGLDVIEISGNSSLTQGSVSVGKYINNKLFLNYERTFALDKKDKVINPDKITLEYQFYRSLFIQATNQSANSGFDFIFKKTWK